MIGNNEVRLIGNVVKEPETFSTTNGNMGKLRIACNTKRFDGTEDSLFIDVKMFGKTYDDLVYYEINRGDKVIACGKLVIEEWTDKEDNKRREPVIYATNVMKFHKKAKTESF